MNKEDFKKRKEEIQVEIDKWKQELRDLKSKYISSNQQFPVGSKICIISPERAAKLFNGANVIFPESKRYAYVTGYEIQGDVVVPTLKKAKKDGSMSKVNDFITFEMLEKDDLKQEKNINETNYHFRAIVSVL